MPVERAVITHAHADHVCAGCGSHLTSRAGEALLRARLGDATIQSAEYAERIVMDGLSVSLHPAGHILGSAQVRLEQGGEVWVVSGDYKLAPDPTCAPFEPIRCHTFVTESTFALPIFRWPAEDEVIEAIHGWWRANHEAGLASLLFVSPLGKAQRLLMRLETSIGPIHAHSAIERMNEVYRAQGIALAAYDAAPQELALTLAPPGASRVSNASTAMVSGWMRIRGTRRRRSLDRGFVLSDHADWPALLAAIDETRAENVWVTHGYIGPLVRWLEEHGRHALGVETRLARAES
jgi:putative mRNA 3-end processing factor